MKIQCVVDSLLFTFTAQAFTCSLLKLTNYFSPVGTRLSLQKSDS